MSIGLSHAKVGLEGKTRLAWKGMPHDVMSGGILNQHGGGVKDKYGRFIRDDGTF